MLQELVVHSRAVAHHQELRCRSLIEVPIALLKAVKKNYDIFNTQTLRSKHRQRRVAARVVKKQGETKGET